MPTEQDVERIVQENSGLVSALVGRTMRLYPRLPSGYDRDDLYSLGNLGLLNAARTYNPERGVAFSTYAYTCIGHAIVGALKREWSQQIDTISLHQTMNEDDDNSLENQIEDPSPDALALAMGQCDQEILKKAVSRLPDREADVIRLLYFEGESVMQVAKRLRRTTQAVQTTHVRALKALRLRLRELGIRQWDN
jgi:RNA polymerase sigma factor (sigma-70 family)